MYSEEDYIQLSSVQHYVFCPRQCGLMYVEDLCAENVFTARGKVLHERGDHGVYVFYGSMNPQLAIKTGFSDEDAQAIKEALRTLFVNDASSARPEGSMEVHRVYWWEHNSPNGQYSSAKVHRLLRVKPNKDEPRSIEDYDITLGELPGLKCEVIEGE